MIAVISRSFGISDQRESSAAKAEQSRARDERISIEARERTGEKDLFDMARSIAFRARKRRIRSSRII